LIRNIDYLARYGGEEFCCLLPETGMPAAIMVAERFREAIEKHENNFDDNVIKVTISLGVAEFRSSMESAHELVKNADNALLRAKREGRNRVVIMDCKQIVRTD